MNNADILIIGAGAIGSAIAMELSKYDAKIVVVDKNEDIGGDASKSNSAIIHTGYDALPDSLESELVVAANPLYEKLTKDLDVPYMKVGAVLPAFTDEQFDLLPSLKEKAFKNRVYDVEYLGKEKLLKMEPNLSSDVKAGLFIPRENLIDPFLLVVGYAEVAQQNGVKFLLNSKVNAISRTVDEKFLITTSAGEIKATYVINAAGLYCDDIASLIGKKNYSVNPRRGQFYILDKNTSCKVKHIVLPIPTKVTKGKLVCPTIHGNILVGPTAEDLEDKEDASTTFEGLSSIISDARKLIPNINFNDTITQYSGLRANKKPEGISIETYSDIKNFINISGVRSTGLTASISIGKYVQQLLLKIGMPYASNLNYNPKRIGIPNFNKLSYEEKEKLIKFNPNFGHIICRCETITEGEIVEACHRPIPALSLDAIKRRLRPGTGRCQGGFCSPKILEIISRELRITPNEITKKGNQSYLVVEKKSLNGDDKNGN